MPTKEELPFCRVSFKAIALAGLSSLLLTGCSNITSWKDVQAAMDHPLDALDAYADQEKNTRVMTDLAAEPTILMRPEDEKTLAPYIDALKHSRLRFNESITLEEALSHYHLCEGKPQHWAAKQLPTGEVHLRFVCENPSPLLGKAALTGEAFEKAITDVKATVAHYPDLKPFATASYCYLNRRQRPLGEEANRLLEKICSESVMAEGGKILAALNQNTKNATATKSANKGSKSASTAPQSSLSALTHQEALLIALSVKNISLTLWHSDPLLYWNTLTLSQQSIVPPPVREALRAADPTRVEFTVDFLMDKASTVSSPHFMLSRVSLRYADKFANDSWFPLTLGISPPSALEAIYKNENLPLSGLLTMIPFYSYGHEWLIELPTVEW